MILDSSLIIHFRPSNNHLYAGSVLQLFPSRAVAIDILGFGIHWYGLLYLAAFMLAWVLLPRLQRYRNLDLTSEEWADLLSWGVIGVVVGGRLGFVLFYEPSYFLDSPLRVFAVWEGGMSSHGGFLGVTLSLLWIVRKKGLPVLALADVIVVPVALGLMLGRLGNFINQELYGTVTSLPWGISIPGVEGLRHPTQLYAMLKDLVIAFACFAHLSLPGSTRGRTAAIFLILYGVLRFLLEYLRIQEYPLLPLPLFFSRGQLLTLPIVVVGVPLWWRTRVFSRHSHPSPPLR